MGSPSSAGGLNRGSLATSAATVWYSWLMVSSRLTLDPTAASVGPHAGHGDVPLQHRGVHQARGVADPVALVVVQHRLVVQRRLVLRRDQPGLVVQPVVVPPVELEADRRPARRPVLELAADRVAADERPVVASRCPRSIQPKPSSLAVTRSWSLKANRLEENSTLISTRPASIRAISSASSPNGPHAVRPSRPRPPRRVPAIASPARDEHLVAEVAGVAGARDGDRRARRSWCCSPKNGRSATSGASCPGSRGSAGPGPRACRAAR